MTNNYDNEDHENGDFVEHEISDQEKPHGAAGKLGEAWRTRPLFKFMVLVIAVFAVAVAGFSFFGGKDATNVANLARPPSLHEAPGGPASPYMIDQTKMASDERARQAAAGGGSAIPTPIGQTTNVGDFGDNATKDDPLNELRAETETLKKQVETVKAQQTAQPPQPKAPPEPFDNSLAEAMQRQMQQLLEGWSPKGMKEVAVVKPDDIKKEQDASNKDGANANGVQPQQPPKTVVPAGTVSYAQLLTEANSDVPGPILAQIVSGPLAGSRAIGAFKVAEGYEKYLVLRFSLADKKGKDYSIDAIALDPNTTLGGMATEVDERYFVRLVLPAAAGFLQGMGESLGQGNASIETNGSTTIATTTSNGFHQGVYQGLSDAANTAGQFFQNQANLTKPLVRVASGTPMGLFFITPVFEPNSGTPGSGQPYGNGGIPAYNSGVGGQNGGYPGTTISGYGNNAVQQNIANGLPYPNYASPSSGYNNGINGYNGANSYSNNPAVQQNIANGVPYPNYANPASSYNNLGSSVTHTGYGYNGGLQ